MFAAYALGPFGMIAVAFAMIGACMPMTASGSESGDDGVILYAELRQAHLGGDDFQIEMLWIDTGTDAAQHALVRSDGRVLSLARARSEILADIALPSMPAPAHSSGPPVVVEGRGAVGIAAVVAPDGAVTMREYESTDPEQVGPVEPFADFFDRLAQSLSGRAPVPLAPLYVQFRPLGDAAQAPRIDLALTAGDLDSSDRLRALTARPFKLVAIDPGALGDAAPIARFRPGRPHYVSVLGSPFEVMTYSRDEE